LSTLALVPSPLLGPAVWQPVAAVLRERGERVLVVGHPREIRTPADVREGLIAQLPDEDLVLVPHSNAGLYASAVAVARPVRAVVYVDAGIAADEGPTPVAPAGLREHLAGLADADGLLPPWTQWWPESEAAGLFPDPRSRAAVENEQRRLPLAYFEADVPAPASRPTVPSAYLAFGETYAAERSRAQRAGWPVVTLAGGHLHMLHDPPGVADVVQRLALAAD
jgi:pimeloyl-ACP methyl ester carboxylesterase